jgi:hypothetical protein
MPAHTLCSLTVDTTGYYDIKTLIITVNTSNAYKSLCKNMTVTSLVTECTGRVVILYTPIARVTDSLRLSGMCFTPSFCCLSRFTPGTLLHLLSRAVLLFLYVSTRSLYTKKGIISRLLFQENEDIRAKSASVGKRLFSSTCNR